MGKSNLSGAVHLDCGKDFVLCTCLPKTVAMDKDKFLVLLHKQLFGNVKLLAKESKERKLL